MPNPTDIFAYDLTYDDITIQNLKEDLKAPGLVDENNRFDTDRSNAPMQLHELVGHVTQGPPYNTVESNDRVIARVVRIATALYDLVESWEGQDDVYDPEKDGEFTIWLALEVVMVWEFG